jgi:hypothetical protein
VRRAASSSTTSHISSWLPRPARYSCSTRQTLEFWPSTRYQGLVLPSVVLLFVCTHRHATHAKNMRCLPLSSPNEWYRLLMCCSPVTLLSISGQYESEFRIVAACRDGCVYSLKEGWVPSSISSNVSMLWSQRPFCVLGDPAARPGCWSAEVVLTPFRTNARLMCVHRINKTVIVGCMDSCLYGYSTKVRVGA